jgi:hypothetical protein
MALSGASARGRWIGGLLLAAMSLAAQAAWPPLSLRGEIGYDLRHETIDRFGSQTDNLGIMRVNGTSYVYEPWLAQVEGGFGATFRESDGQGESTNAQIVSGLAKLRLFPMSRFPFETFFERTDSTVDSTLSGIDFDVTRMGISQRYTAENGTTFHGRYEHQDIRQDIGRLVPGAADQNDSLDILQFGANRSFGAHDVTFDSDLQSFDRTETGDQVDTLFGLLRHGYRPGPRLSADTQLTYNHIGVRQRGTAFDNDLVQLNSFAFWRPESKRPLLVNGTFRVLRFGTQTQLQDSTATSFTGTVGTSYEWTPNLQFTADAGMTHIAPEGATTTVTFQRAGATYTSDDHELWGFQYNWILGGSLENDTDPLGALQTQSVEVGHNVTRAVPFGSSMLTLSSNESSTALADTEGRRVLILLHDAGATWSYQELARSTIARVSVSDSRTFGGGGRLGDERNEFQLLNLQFSVDQRLGRSSSLSGDVTMQAIRQKAGNASTFAFGRQSDGFLPVATLDVTYQSQQVFDVPRLRFRSTVRLISDTYLPLVTEPTDPYARDDMDWENRLEYSIGRIDFRLIGRLSQFRDNGRSLLLFQVRRHFGGL